jgi:16S rRNA (cytosine1402-N4)-methyltransferase
MIGTFQTFGLLPDGRRGAAGWLGGLLPGEGGGGVVFAHRPVLLEEVVALLRPVPGKTFFDLTLGGGGHSAALLEAGAAVTGLDRDPAALAAAGARLAGFGARFRAIEGNFARFPELLGRAGAGPADGILLDLGVSSPQLDDAERGFSFMRDGPLDMRMGRDVEVTAADLVNGYGEAELAGIFKEFGEEPRARLAARAIVARRARGPLASTGELAECLERALGRRGPTHPGTRVFQALRIAVNGELTALTAALAAAAGWLAPGGRLAVITFHSLEDRIVKQFMRAGCQAALDRPEWPAPRPNPEWVFTDLTRRALAPAAAELAANPRARSAKLRAVERRAP